MADRYDKAIAIEQKLFETMDRLNAQIHRFEHGRIYPLQDMTTINQSQQVIIKKWQGLSMGQKRPVQGLAGIAFSVKWGLAMA